MSTFEKIYSAKMWLMSTFENENLKIIFFVSTFLDWYKEKYNALQNQSVGWQNELLKKELESRSPSESLDVQLFQKAVYKVLIAYDTTVTLQLINRKIF